MARLADHLDTLEPTAFNQMNSRNCREALKEVSKTTADATIKAEIAKLSDSQKDVLMKVVYVGLSSDPAAAPTFLKWHAILFEASGPGAIIRTLTSQAPVAAQEGAAAAAAKG